MAEFDNDHLEIIHHEGFDPSQRIVYVPAIRKVSGTLVFISGITAAPPYHDHPHRPEQFEAIPSDIDSQVELLYDHIDLALNAAGCRRQDIVVMNRFFTHVREDQDVVNAHQGKWLGGHIPTSTSVEVKSLATDPKLRLEISVVAVARG